MFPILSFLPAIRIIPKTSGMRRLRAAHTGFESEFPVDAFNVLGTVNLVDGLSLMLSWFPLLLEKEAWTSWGLRV